LRIAARLADGCNLQGAAEQVAAKVELLRGYCAEAGRDPAEVAVTVLDVPIIGRDRDDVADRIERVRGRASAKSLAVRAGTAAEQARRYRSLVELGVGTVFVAPAELRGPADVADFSPVTGAFR
jgi:alkanesulfonate monooxygenase SsuD/methylene tetrahydromethanopterin reductase-like flavin-dependent oxidoreductase (luciferase family)